MIFIFVKKENLSILSLRKEIEFIQQAVDRVPHFVVL